MKKILAVLLSVLMLSSTGVLGAIFAGAEGTSSSGAITIDGKFDDPAWVADGWTHVDSSNAKVQTPLKEGEIRRENYDFQMRTDDANLYVAMKFNAPPVGTDTINGNGKGTTFRLWIYTDGVKDGTGVEYITYNSFVEYYYKPSGDVLRVIKNTNALGNSGSAVNDSGVTGATTKGDNYWYVELKVPFTFIGSTEGSHFYLTVSGPTEIDESIPSTQNQPTNNAWAYPYYGDGMEANGNADAMYVEWNKDNDLDIKFEDIRIGKLPATAQKIDSFGDYVAATTTIYTRVNGKTTLGEVSAITFSAAKDFNNFYMASVDANGRVVEINMFASSATPKPPESLKGNVVIPEGGFVLLCNADKSDTHTQAMIDTFKTIKVGDIIGLYNVDLKALAAGATKTNLTNAGFTVSKKVEYAEGVTMEANAAEVKVRGNKALGVLSDGKTELIDSSKNFEDEQVILFQNLVCTEAGKYPVVNLILNLGTPVKFDTVNLSFYHSYNYMIGLPKDNKVTISYANDPANFTTLGDYTFEGAAAAGTQGVLPANIALGRTVLAKYVKVSFKFGDSPFANSTPSKPVWEFIGMTEFGVSSTVPATGTTPNLLANAEQVVANKGLAVLTNGKTALDDESKKRDDAQVVLFQNKVCTTANLFPKVELVLAYATPKTIDTIVLGFYHEYNQMVGLPKDNKVSISYSNDHAAGYTSLGEITLDGTPEAGKNGVVTYSYKLNKAVKARFIKISFAFGKAPWETDGKTNWEFIGMTEFNAYGYAEGVTATYTNVALQPSSRSLRSLIDGNTAKSIQTYNDGSVLLFKNNTATDTSKQAKVELLFTLSKNTLINAATLNFYHEYDSKIGLPKDNKVTISYTNNYNDFTPLGDFTFEGQAEAGKKGVISAYIPFGGAVTAKYVKISFEYGPSPFTDKPVWEFIALTEVSFTDATKPVSIGKSYTGSTAARSGWTDTNPATKLTDGNVGTLATVGSNGPFVGFQVTKNEEYTYTSGAWVGAGTYTYSSDERDANGNFYQIIDLGETLSDLKIFSAKFGQIAAWGVYFPTKVTFSASEDGTTFTSIGDATQGRVENNGAATLKEWADYTLISNTGIKARYIKIVITPFLPEITAPTTAGNEGDKVTQSKLSVTAISEITIGYANMSSGVVYSNKAPVTTDYAYNVALGKDWFGIDYHPNIPQYNGDFTDGVYATGSSFSYGAPWFSFYRNGDKGNIDTNLYGEVIIDLGSDGTGIGALRMQVAPGIGEAEYIKVYASNNGITWDEVGTVTYSGKNIQWATCTFEKSFDARYIKVGIKNKGMFFMVSEIEVIKYIPASTFSVDFANQYSVGYQNPGTWTYNGGETLAGVGDAVYIYTPDKGKTLGEAASQGIAWWQVWVIDFDTDAKQYYIKEFYPVNNGSSKAGIAIPEKGFVVASSGHGNLAFDAILTTHAAIGAPVYVYGMDIRNLGVKDTMDFVKTNIISVFVPLEGRTPYIPNFTEGDQYPVGVTNISDPEKVGCDEDLSVLTDGKKALTDAKLGYNDEQVVLFKNKTATTAGVYPTAALVLNLGQSTTFNTIDLTFYIEHISMIGLPKDNKITISYATDPSNFVPLATYTFEGEVKSGDKGIFEAKLNLGTLLTAQYVKIEFSYGDSPFQDKPVWEWIGLTEIGVSTTQIADLPDNAFVIDNIGGYSATTTIYTRNGNLTTIGDVCEYIRGSRKDYNYTYLVAVGADGKVIEVNLNYGTQNGKKDTYVIPEGGYVLLCNLNTSTTHTQAVIDAFKTIAVGDTITLYNVDLDVLATAKSEIALEKAGFTVTKATQQDPFELKDPNNDRIKIVDGMLLGITDSMTVDQIKALFAGQVTVERVGTGATITAGGQSIVMIILGDIDGDGVIDSTDYLLVKRAILGNTTLNAAQNKAACVSGGTEPDSVDYLMIKRHIVGTDSLFD